MDIATTVDFPAVYCGIEEIERKVRQQIGEILS